MWGSINGLPSVIPEPLACSVILFVRYAMHNPKFLTKSRELILILAFIVQEGEWQYMQIDRQSVSMFVKTVLSVSVCKAVGCLVRLNFVHLPWCNGFILRSNILDCFLPLFLETPFFVGMKNYGEFHTCDTWFENCRG